MIPGLSTRQGNKIALSIIAALVLLLGWAALKVAANVQGLKKHGVLIRGVVINKQYPKGVGKFTVHFKFQGHYYDNTFSSEEFDCKTNDSVTVKINSEDPMGYCVPVAVSSK